MNLDFSSFEKALTLLQRVLVRSNTVPGDEDIRDACIQEEGQWGHVYRSQKLNSVDATPFKLI